MKTWQLILGIFSIWVLGILIGYINTYTPLMREIDILEDQITIRDTINAQNIKIHKQDSIRIQWLFTHDRK